MNVSNNVFLSKVSIIIAGSIILASQSFVGIQAQVQIQETLLSGECHGQLTITAAHGYDFGNFDVSDVATGSYFQTQGIYLDNGNGKEHSTFGDIKQAVRAQPANDRTTWVTSEASTFSGRMLAVADPCPAQHNGRELQIQAFNLVHSTNPAIELNIDAMRVYNTWYLYLLGDTSPVENNEVQGFTAHEWAWWLNLVYGIDTDNTIMGDASHGVVMNRTWSTNLLPWEFGVNIDFAINIPRNQPAGTYTGDIILTLVEL